MPIEFQELGAAAGIGLTSLLMVAVIVFVSALMRGLTGFGFAIAAVPLMSIIVDPKLAVGVCVALPIASGLLDLPHVWPQTHRPALLKLVGGALVGTPLGMIALGAMPVSLQRLAIAVIAVLALIVVLLVKRPTKSFLEAFPGTTGVASGLLNGLAGMPGPPVIVYFLTLPIAPATARSSLIVFFLATGLVATATGLATGVVTAQTLLISLLCLAPFLIGNALGGALFRVSEARLYRKAALLILFAGAASAAWKGVAGMV